MPPRNPRRRPLSRRQRLDFPDRGSLERATSRLLDDPLVESCSVNVPRLLVEVGLAEHAVRTQQDVSDWRRRYLRSRGRQP
jgi:hypothetical protein